MSKSGSDFSFATSSEGASSSQKIDSFRLERVYTENTFKEMTSEEAEKAIQGTKNDAGPHGKRLHARHAKKRLAHRPDPNETTEIDELIKYHKLQQQREMLTFIAGCNTGAHFDAVLAKKIIQQRILLDHARDLIEIASPRPLPNDPFRDPLHRFDFTRDPPVKDRLQQEKQQGRERSASCRF